MMRAGISGSLPSPVNACSSPDGSSTRSRPIEGPRPASAWHSILIRCWDGSFRKEIDQGRFLTHVNEDSLVGGGDGRKDSQVMRDKGLVTERRPRHLKQMPVVGKDHDLSSLGEPRQCPQNVGRSLIIGRN
jgi:hypothetical protein